MGKDNLTKKQKTILDLAAKNEYIRSSFYFTGGTALSACYLQHRQSDDIDIFTQNTLDSEIIFGIVSKWAHDEHFTFESRKYEVVYRFAFTFAPNEIIKVDFASYPYPEVEKKNQFYGLKTDSMFDIAVNKIQTISQRTEVKDFVDLYFLLKEYTFWDMNYGLERKFKQKFDPYLFSGDLMKVQTFTYLPIMYKHLTLDKLKKFFIDMAVTLARTVVE